MIPEFTSAWWSKLLTQVGLGVATILGLIAPHISNSIPGYVAAVVPTASVALAFLAQWIYTHYLHKTIQTKANLEVAKANVEVAKLRLVTPPPTSGTQTQAA